MRMKIITSGSSFRDTSAPTDLSQPELYGLPPSTTLLHLPLATNDANTTSSTPSIAAWLMSPEGDQKAAKLPLVLFLHGACRDRGVSHRSG